MLAKESGKKLAQLAVTYVLLGVPLPVILLALFIGLAVIDNSLINTALQNSIFLVSLPIILTVATIVLIYRRQSEKRIFAFNIIMLCIGMFIGYALLYWIAFGSVINW